VGVATAHPEFADWRWDDPARLAAHIVPFKREAYRAALDLLTERA
jgi:putative (di)nucleoside polyphosphate hydrolase